MPEGSDGGFCHIMVFPLPLLSSMPSESSLSFRIKIHLMRPSRILHRVNDETSLRLTE